MAASSRAPTSAPRPAPLIVLGGGGDFLHREAGHNRGSGPSLEERFICTSVPGFGDTINFGHYYGPAARDGRNAAGYATRGGLYQASLHAYRPAGGDSDGDGCFAFQRLDVDLVQHVPILRENWIISLHGRLSTTMTDDGKTVPFYLLPRIDTPLGESNATNATLAPPRPLPLEEVRTCAST